MTWILFVIYLASNQYYVQTHSVHQSEEDCIAMEMYFLSTAPHPKLNYDTICVKTDQLERF